MNWKKIIGYGLLIWVIMFVVVSIFVGFKAYEQLWAQIVTALVSGVISFILAGYLKPESIGKALGLGAMWVVIGLILDAIISTRFNSAIFSQWTLWLGYALVLIAPLFKIKKSTGTPAVTQ